MGYADKEILAGVSLFLFLLIATEFCILYEGYDMQKKAHEANEYTSFRQDSGQGKIIIEGKAVPVEGTEFKPPASTLDAVFCEWELFQKKWDVGFRHFHTEMQKVEEGSIGDYFYVENSQGRILVDARNAEIEIPMDTNTGITDKIIRYLNKNDIDIDDSFDGKFNEYCIREKNNVLILGYAETNPFAVEDDALGKSELIIKDDSKANFYIYDKYPSFFFDGDIASEKIQNSVKWILILSAILIPCLKILNRK